MRRLKPKAALKVVLKLLLVSTLFYFLAKKGFISFERTGRAFAHWEYSLPAMSAILITQALCAYRWQILLRAQGLELKLSRTFQLTYIGNFFNLALPGAVSGDFVKAFYVAKESQGRRGHAFGTILFDRLTGVSALVFVSAFAMLFSLGKGWGSEVFNAIFLIMGLAAAGALVFFGYLFLVKASWDPLLRLLQRLETRAVKFGSLTRIYEGIRHYHHHKSAVVQALSISFLSQLLATTSALAFAYALGEGSIPPWGVLAVVPVGLLVTAVPVMPGGIGTGHAAFSWLFLLLGSERGADVFSLMVLTQFLGGAIGGLIYLRYKSETSVPTFQSTASTGT